MTDTLQVAKVLRFAMQPLGAGRQIVEYYQLEDDYITHVYEPHVMSDGSTEFTIDLSSGSRKIISVRDSH